MERDRKIDAAKDTYTTTALPVQNRVKEREEMCIRDSIDCKHLCIPRYFFGTKFVLFHCTKKYSQAITDIIDGLPLHLSLIHISPMILIPSRNVLVMVS